MQVVINTNNGSTTITKVVNYLSPIVNINTISSLNNFNCNTKDFSLSVTNPPVNNFNYIWTSNNVNTTIDGLPSPITTPNSTATLYRDPTITDPVGIFGAVNASCGVINSPFYPGFSGCFPWSNYFVYGFADPLNGGGNIIANIEPLNEAMEYEWWISYWEQFHLLGATPNPYLQSGYLLPSVDEVSVWVRALTSSGYTELKFVGSFSNSGGYRMAATTTPLKISPNPIQDVILIEYENKEKPYQIEMYTWKGVKVKEVKANSKKVNINVSNLEKGKYLVTIRQGKTLLSKQIVK